MTYNNSSENGDNYVVWEATLEALPPFYLPTEKNSAEVQKMICASLGEDAASYFSGLKMEISTFMTKSVRENLWPNLAFSEVEFDWIR